MAGNPAARIPGHLQDREGGQALRGAFPAVIVLLMLLLLLTPAVAARDVKVGLHEIPPMIYTDETGKPAGLFVDMVQDVAAREGWNVTWVHGTLNENWNRLAAGEIDLMAGVVDTPDREALYDFNREPALSSWSQVYASPGSGIKTMLDLNGKRVAVVRGDINGLAFRDYATKFGINVTYIQKDTLGEAMNGTASGEADAMVAFSLGDEPSTWTPGIVPTTVIFNPTSLHFAVPKGKDADLLDAFDRYIAEGKTDPSSAYETTMQKWFGVKGASSVIPPYVWECLAIIAGLAALFVIASIFLRREVRRKTAELTRQNEELHSAYEQLTATEEELRGNYRNLHTVEQELIQARKKLTLLNRLTLEAIQSGIFSLEGYLHLATAAGCNPDAEGYLRKGKEYLTTVEDTIRFAKKYQDLGINHSRWQDVKYVIISAISHLDSSRISRSIELGNLEIYADPLLEDVFVTILEQFLLRKEGTIGIDVRYRKNADDMTIIIRGDGPGIPAEEKERIFEWEYKGQGGPALFLAREILSITGITITETGEPGTAARFEITVPSGKYRFGIGKDQDSGTSNGNTAS